MAAIFPRSLLAATNFVSRFACSFNCGTARLILSPTLLISERSFSIACFSDKIASFIFVTSRRRSSTSFTCSWNCLSSFSIFLSPRLILRCKPAIALRRFIASSFARLISARAPAFRSSNASALARPSVLLTNKAKPPFNMPAIFFSTASVLPGGSSADTIFFSCACSFVSAAVYFFNNASVTCDKVPTCS